MLNDKVTIRRLSPADSALMDVLLSMFGDVFDQPETYTGAKPSPGYIRRLLQSDSFIALAALAEHKVVGGLVAYELKKFEQERSEIYLYDLAVRKSHRRQGLATALIEALKKIAQDIGAYTIFVQADRNEEDKPAIALYKKLGKPAEEVLHFDIPVGRQ